MTFNFGTAAKTQPSLFGGTQTGGGLFGQAASSAPTGFGGFGQPTQSTATTGFSGFGGAPASSAATGFGGFGAPTAAATSANTFGFGNPSAAAAPQSLGFQGFGTPAAGSTGGGGAFGVGGATTGTGLFGAQSTAPKFGAGLATGTPGFGLSAATSTATGFGSAFGAGGGSMFGAKPAATTGLGGGLFSAPQQTAAATAANSLAVLTTAVTAPVLFGDERDSVIAKWNQLQAFWGTGRAYCNQQGLSVDLTPSNPLSLFKAVGYACMPSSRNEDGLLALVVSKKVDEVRTAQQVFVDALQRILGSKPNISVCVEGLKALLDETKTEMTIYVQDRSPAGTMTRVPASDVQTFLSQPAYQQHLSSICVSNLYPKSGMTPDQLKLYLDTPPSGIDPRIWDQAKLDNPDSNRLIPVPMVGFEELRNRLKQQCQQTELYQSRLDMLGSDISTLQHNLTDMIAKLDQYKRNQQLLGHRVLKVLVGQEIHRKQGYAIQPNEEQMRAHLECIATELNAPTQFKGRLNELMSQLRLQQNQMSGVSSRCDMSGYQLDNNVQLELRQHLKQQQEGLRNLIDIITGDLEDLRTIEQGLTTGGTVAGAGRR